MVFIWSATIALVIATVGDQFPGIEIDHDEPGEIPEKRITILYRKDS